MDAIAPARRTMPNNTLNQSGFACDDQRRGTSLASFGFRGLITIAAIGACLTSTAFAGERSAGATHEQSAAHANSNWKGHNLLTYGDRFKAALHVQAQEARKPSWSWRDDDQLATVAKKD